MRTNSLVASDPYSSDPPSVVGDGDEGKWKDRLVKTMLAFGFFAGNLILNSVLITIINERVPTNTLPLPDVSFDLWPLWPSTLILVEGYMTALMVMLLLLVVFHRSGYRIAQRYCVVSGVVYWLRAMCIVATSLPPVQQRHFQCAPKLAPNITSYEFLSTIVHRSMVYIPTLGAQSMASEFFCGDYLYSGHTINVVMGYSFLSIYLMPAEVKATSMLWWLADQVLFVLSIVSVLLLMLSRGHYLVDVLFAYYVTTRTLYMYHTVCGHESLHYCTPDNYFPKFWWWPLFVFFEVDNPGRVAVVNRFHNPFTSIQNFLTNSGTKSSPA